MNDDEAGEALLQSLDSLRQDESEGNNVTNSGAVPHPKKSAEKAKAKHRKRIDTAMKAIEINK